ncbi:MAG: hypothetical protein KDA87_19190 [Planctomycetales bacterium]|nr:hypothetical protein [Planctomycetales bacterium]
MTGSKHIVGILIMATCTQVTALWAQPVANDSVSALEPKLPTPIVTRQHLFSIPFFLNSRTEAPTEVTLFVSGNQGASWSVYQRRPVTANRFDFQAGVDGEYWFVVASDRSPVEPTADTRPEKIVVVDRQLPEVQLTVDSQRSERVQARWQSSDNYLEPASFRLHYRYANSEQWIPVDVVLPPKGSGQRSFAGETSWTVSSPGQAIVVRADILDEAGNEGAHEQTFAWHNDFPERSATTETSSPAAVTEVTALPSRQERQATREDSGALPSATLDQSNATDALYESASHDSLASYDDTQKSDLDSNRTTSFTSEDTPVATSETRAANDAGWQASLSAQSNSVSQTYDSLEANRANSQALLDGYSHEPATTDYANLISQVSRSDNPADVQLPNNESNTAASNAASAADSTIAPTFDSNPWSSATDNPLASRDRSSQPPKQYDSPEQQLQQAMQAGVALEDIHMTNSRRFNLEYDVQDVGRSGLARVELWVTRDYGRTWSALGTDADRQSPFEVNLEQEGIYGFRLLVHNGSGLSNRSPQPGDDADLFVGLDETDPVVELTGAEVQRDAMPALLINWQAHDTNLVDTPIQLKFAETANGPWQPLTRALQNTGRVDLPIDSQLPGKFLLKIEALDRAGNVGEMVYPHAIVTKDLGPKGTIRAFQPVGE